MKRMSLSRRIALTCAAVGWLCWSADSLCLGQNAGNALSPDLQEVVKLSQARMPDDIIKNYIVSTGKSFKLSAEDIINLSNQGVSDGIISALQTTVPVNPVPQPVVPQPAVPMSPVTSPTPAPAALTVPMPSGPAPAVSVNLASPTVAAPPTDAPQLTPQEVNFQYFHDQLAPYGSWLNINGTLYWRPDQAIALDPDWRPYYDMGQWVQTDNGLYWQSDYTWGDIPFHYGRWILYPDYGWLWAPDYVWGPAWVFWRQDDADGCIGWAPLPVGAVYVDGALRYHGAVVGADFDFGLGEACFTFVSYDHFHEPFFRMRGHEWAYHIDRQRLDRFYNHSVIRDDFRHDDHGRFINYGIGHDRIDHLTHVEHADFEERNPVGDRNRLGQWRTEDSHRSDSKGFEGGRPSGPAEVPGAHGQGFGPEHSGPQSSVGKVYRPPSGGSFPRQRR